LGAFNFIRTEFVRNSIPLAVWSEMTCSDMKVLTSWPHPFIAHTTFSQIEENLLENPR